MSIYIGVRMKVIDHTVDLSELYLKEGSTVLVADRVSAIHVLYERRLPDEEYWSCYNFSDSDTPHDIIHIVRKNGICKIFFNPDDQERELAEKDNLKKGETK